MYIYNCNELDRACTYTGKSFKLLCPEIKRGEALLLTPTELAEAQARQCIIPAHEFTSHMATGTFAVGTTLTSGDNALFTVVLRMEIPAAGKEHSMPCIRLVANKDIPKGEIIVVPCRNAPALAWITISDKGYHGERKDISGPAIAQLVHASTALRCSSGYIVPDDIRLIRARITDLAINQGYDLIITSGGTGVSPSDVTPEAVLPILEKRLYGFEQAMMSAALKETPRALNSRALAGTIGESLVITLPGSVKAVQQNLAPLMQAALHALEKLQGNTADCAVER